MPRIGLLECLILLVVLGGPVLVMGGIAVLVVWMRRGKSPPEK